MPVWLSEARTTLLAHPPRPVRIGSHHTDEGGQWVVGHEWRSVHRCSCSSSLWSCRLAPEAEQRPRRRRSPRRRPPQWPRTRRRPPRPEATPAEIDLSPGLMVFGAVPPQPSWEVGNIYFPDGSTDYWNLFTESAAWEEARSNIGAFKIHSWMARVFFSDEQIITLTATSTPRHPTHGRGRATHPADHLSAHRVLRGSVRARGRSAHQSTRGPSAPWSSSSRIPSVKNDGPGSCQYPLERVIDEVVAWVEDMREIFPGVPVGSIEGVWQSPATTPEDMATWLDAYEAAMGEPFAFLHMDVDWRRSDWTDIVRGIEEVADARGCPSGSSTTAPSPTPTATAGSSKPSSGSPSTSRPPVGHPTTSSSSRGRTGQTRCCRRPRPRHSPTSSTVSRPSTRARSSLAESDGQPVIEDIVTDASTGIGLAGLPVTVSATPMTGMIQDVTITARFRLV